MKIKNLKFKNFFLIIFICLVVIFVNPNKVSAWDECYYISNSSNLHFAAKTELKSFINKSVSLTIDVANDKNTNSNFLVKDIGMQYKNLKNGITVISSDNISAYKRNKSRYGTELDKINQKSCPDTLYIHVINAPSATYLTISFSNIYSNTKTYTLKNVEKISEYYTYVQYGKLSLPNNTDIPVENTCEGIFGSADNENSIRYMINQGLKIMQLSVPILIIALGTVDFAKAVIASKEDEMRKAQSTFFKRLIAGLVVFFIPYLVQLLMTIMDFSIKSMC